MDSRRTLQRGVAIAVLALLGAACGSADSDSLSVADTPSAAPATQPPAADASADVEAAAAETPTDVPEILQFSSPLVGGGELDAATLSGKATAFWFWSPT